MDRSGTITFNEVRATPFCFELRLNSWIAHCSLLVSGNTLKFVIENLLFDDVISLNVPGLAKRL